MVRIGSTVSGKKNIDNGVPQGSVLGPILFNIFFNDITEIGAPVDQALFADDIAAWTVSNLTSIINVRLNKFLKLLQDWMFKWRLKISTQKTVSCIFNKGCLHYENELKLTYNDQNIEAERNPKFLGVTLDPGLRLNKYAENIKSRTTRRLNMLRSIGGRNWGASSKIKLITYKALIRPLIDYVPFAPLVMYETNKQVLERIQLKALKYTFNLPQSTSSNTVYEKAKIDPILTRSKAMTIKYLNKAMLTNSLVRKLIETYNEHEKLDEGIVCKTIPRLTVMGVIKLADANCSTIFKQPQN
jgi:hypothetical protein